MDLDSLPDLSPSDQWTFVLGRIAEGAVEMDAQLRSLRTTLAGESGIDATLDAAWPWNATIDACRRFVGQRELNDRAREAIASVLKDADKAWTQRNRYMHDLLVDTIKSDEDTWPVVEGSLGENRRLRRRLARDRSGNAPDSEIVSLHHAVELVTELVSMAWRLRAARGFVDGSRMWNDTLFGHVTGEWDGSATFVSDDDDDDDEDEDEDEDDQEAASPKSA